MNVPKGWKQINDACIGVPDGKGWKYTVYHVGARPNWRWEACKGKELLAMNLNTMDEACDVCRADYKSGGGK